MLGGRVRSARWRPVSFFSRPAEAADGAAHGRFADRHPLGFVPAAALFRQGRVVVRVQLGPEERGVFRVDVPRAGPAGTRFGREGVRRRQLDVPFDGSQPDGKALGHLLRGAFLANHGVDDAFAEIDRIGFHPPSLLDWPITLQGALALVSYWGLKPVCPVYVCPFHVNVTVTCTV